MKAIIPVAGAGTKLRPLTYTQPKALIPIAGKTILGVIVDQLIEAGVTEYVFVIGYLGEKIQRYIDKTYPQLSCTFVTQSDRRGTGHAIWLTRDAVQDDEVMIVLGDTVCDYNVKEIISSAASQIGVRKVDDPRSFGVAELNDKDIVTRMVEKPLIPKSNMAMVGIYYIKEAAAMYAALEKNLAGPADDNGEYHLTNALQLMIESGISIHAFRVNNWFDCGKKETLLSTNAILLKQMDDQPPTACDHDYDTTVIIHPVNIAEGCIIRHSIIGPNVSIGEHTKIESSIVRDSIIGSYAELQQVVLNSSIIGNDAYVRGLSQSLNIGDNTEIDLG
ncbi:MAG: NTP transferase domain-containing protein [Taibaiella sp.]|nr:NTP transferase domain-containing protein [Taibaiella sp.]